MLLLLLLSPCTLHLRPASPGGSVEYIRYEFSVDPDEIEPPPTATVPATRFLASFSTRHKRLILLVKF